MNRVTLMGNLGRDVELRKTQNGTSVASFSMATTERYTGKDGQKVEKTQWHNVVAWGKLAEVCTNHLHKGDKVLVSGKVEYRSYEAGGVTKYATDIIIDEMHFLPNGKSEPRQHDQQQSQQQQPQLATMGEYEQEELPF